MMCRPIPPRLAYAMVAVDTTWMAAGTRCAEDQR